MIKKNKNIKCSDCGFESLVAMTSWQDSNGNQYYKKGERRCLNCHKKHTGISFNILKKHQ